jgi:alpha-tubulin suppressor-like RCC1 family protein
MALPTGAHARAVACGKDFTLVLLHDGRIFSTGCVSVYSPKSEEGMMREGGKSGTHARSGAHAVTGRQVGSVRAAWGGKARYVGGEPS